MRYLLILALLLLSGCGPQRRGEPLTGPLSSLSDPQITGRQVYMLHCHQCHPLGAEGLGPALNDKPLPAPLIKLQVRSGLGAMPAFGPDEIGEAELDALVAYIVALRQSGE